MSPILNTPLVGRRVRALRALHGLTQEQLCERCGINRTTLGRLEDGSPLTRRATFAAIAPVFGMTWQELIDPAPTTLAELADELEQAADR